MARSIGGGKSRDRVQPARPKPEKPRHLVLTAPIPIVYTVRKSGDKPWEVVGSILPAKESTFLGPDGVEYLVKGWMLGLRSTRDGAMEQFATVGLWKLSE